MQFHCGVRNAFQATHAEYALILGILDIPVPSHAVVILRAINASKLMQSMQKRFIHNPE